VDSQAVGREHLRDTIGELLHASELISARVTAGTLGVVGANYRLLEGRAVPDVLLGLPADSTTAQPRGTRRT
jgi:carbonic anhydrase